MYFSFLTESNLFSYLIKPPSRWPRELLLIVLISSTKKHGRAPSAFIWGQTKSPAEAEMIQPSWRGMWLGAAAVMKTFICRRNGLTPSASAGSIDQRRRQSQTTERSNSILSEELRRNYRAAAASTDHLHSPLLIAHNQRMKNGRKSSSRHYWCWLNGRLVWGSACSVDLV